MFPDSACFLETSGLHTTMSPLLDKHVTTVCDALATECDGQNLQTPWGQEGPTPSTYPLGRQTLPQAHGQTGGWVVPPPVPTCWASRSYSRRAQQVGCSYLPCTGVHVTGAYFRAQACFALATG